MPTDLENGANLPKIAPAETQDSGYGDWASEAETPTAPAATSAPVEEKSDYSAWSTGDEQAGKFESSVAFGAERKTEDAQNVLRLQKISGLPEDVVESEKERIQQYSRRKEVDAPAFAKSSPIIAGWLSESPNRTAATWRDLPHLQRIEEHVEDRNLMSTMTEALWGFMKKTNIGKIAAPVAEKIGGVVAPVAQEISDSELGGAFKQGLSTAAANTARIPGYLAEVSRHTKLGKMLEPALDEVREAVGLPDARGQVDWLLNNPAAKKFDELAAKYKTEDQSASIIDAVLKQDWDKAGKIAALQAVANAPNMALTIGLTLAGLPQAAMAQMGLSTAAARLKENKDSGASDDAGFADATFQGAAEALFERMGTVKFVKGWSEALTGKFGKATAVEIFKSMGKVLVASFAQESLEEGATTLAQETSAHLTGTNKTPLNSAEIIRIAKAMVDSSIVGGISGATMSAPAVTIAGAARAQEIKQAKRDKEFYTALGKTWDETEIRKKLPGVTGDIVERLTKDGPIEKVYISAKVLDEYFKEENPVKTMMDLGVLPQYEEAKTTGGDVAIPLSVWADKFVGTPAYQGLANDIKFDSSKMSANELNEAIKEEQAKTEAEAKKGEDQKADGLREAIDTHLQGVNQDESTRGVYAEELERTTRVRAQRLGVDPMELFQRENVPVRTENRSAEGIPALQLLRQQWDAATPEQRITRSLLDPVTNTLNERAFRLMKPPDGSQVAHISVQGIKYVNDNIAHDAGDALYRYVGQALMRHAPGVAKVGGDFALHVKDQAELDRILEAARRDLPTEMNLGGVVVESVFGLSGKVAKTLPEARDLHTSEKKALEEKGLRRRRQDAPAGFQRLEGRTVAPSAVTPATISPELRSSFAAISPNEAFAAVHTDPSGMLSYEAWKQLPPKRYRVSIDLDGLKALNDAYGSTAGDKLLRAFEKAMLDLQKEFGLDLDFTHKSGDEYLAQLDDFDTLNSFWIEAERRLRYATIRVPLSDGRLVVKRGVGLGVGIGVTDAIAEEELQRSKQDRTADRDPRAILGGISESRSTDRSGSEQNRSRDSERSAEKPSGVRARREDTLEQSPLKPSLKPEVLEQASLRDLRDAAKFVAYHVAPSLATSDDPAAIRKKQKEIEKEILSAPKQTVSLSVGPAFEKLNPVDNGRLVESSQAQNEIVLGRIGKNEYVILDGNHRLIWSKRDGVKTLPATIIDLPAEYSDLVSVDGGRGKLSNKDFEVPLEQTSSDGPRGGYYRLEKFIKLNPNADLSTLIHEGAHARLEQDARDYDYLVKNVGPGFYTPEQKRFIETFDGLLKWLDVKTFAGVTKDKHEKVARAYELYFLTGKAPSAEVRDIFARISAWLIDIYKSWKNEYFRGIELSPEVVRYFDESLATQEEIAAAQAEQGMDVLPDLEKLGVIPQVAAKYRADSEEVTRIAEQELREKFHAQRSAERRKHQGERRAQIREEVAKEVNARPEYIALSVLQHGTLPDGTELPSRPEGGFSKGNLAAVKLSKLAIIAQFGEDRLKGLPKPHVYSKATGVHPDVAAHMFGYSSGDELLTAIETAEDRKTLIERTTDELLAAETPDMLEDGSLPVEAMAAVHSEKRAELLRRELELLHQLKPATFKGLARRVSSPIPTVDIVRAAAEEAIAKKKVREINPFSYQRAEARAAREAMELYLRGDIDGAFEAKERQLRNHELYRAALAAKRDSDYRAEKARNYGKPSVRERIGKAGADYLDQIDDLSERFDFRKGISLKAIDKRTALRKWVESQEKEGFTVDVPEKVLNEAYRMHYKDLPYEELVGITDAMEQIAHLARLKNELLGNKLARDVEEAEATLISTLTAHHKMDRPPEDLTPPTKEKIKAGMSKLFASHTRMEFLFEFLDGGKAHGPFWKMLFQPFVEAENAETEMAKRDNEALQKIFSAYTKKERASWFTDIRFIADTKTQKFSGSFTKANAIAIALNWGNDYNRAALLEGYGWTEAQARMILDTLDERDVKTVNALWGYIDTYWPEAEKLQKDITGIAPPKVQGTPANIRGGELKGGYYPIKFDHDRSYRQLQLDEKSSLGENFGHATRAMTRHGHLIERKDTGGKPLLLNLTVLTGHLAQVRHDITHRRAIIDAARILNRTKVREGIEAAAGKQMYRQLNPWLKGIAGDYPLEGIDGWEKWMSHVRSGATVVNLGFKVTSGIVQSLGYLNVIDELGLKYATTSLKNLNPMKLKENWAFVSERSKMMANRLDNYDRDVRDYARKQSAINGAEAAWFYHIGFMDLALSVPAWLGAYQKTMDGGLENVEKGDEKSAIEYADSVVRKTMAAGAAKDLAQVQRGNELKRLFTAFYSQLSIQFNLLQKAKQNFGLTGNKAALVSSLAVLWFLPAALQELIRGRGPSGDDDDEEKLKWYLRKAALYPFQTVVLARDIVNALDRKLETGRKAEFSPTPAIQGFEALINAAGSVAKIGSDEEFTRMDVKEAFMAAGYVFKLPSRQVWLTAEYLYDYATGEVDPDNVVQGLWQALVTGKPRD